MGQQEVYQFLRDNPNRWFTAREICDVLGNARGAICRSLRGLRKRKEVHFTQLPPAWRGFRYKFKE